MTFILWIALALFEYMFLMYIDYKYGEIGLRNLSVVVFTSVSCLLVVPVPALVIYFYYKSGGLKNDFKR